WILSFVVPLLSLFGEDISSGVTSGLIVILGFFLDWTYGIFFELSRWGATPGKLALGLRVTQTSGAPLDVYQAVVRNLLRWVDMMPFGTIGLVSCLLTSRFQRLGDLAAGTVVVYREEKFLGSANQDFEAESAGQRPMVALTRNEQQAVVDYADRLSEWSTPRQEELADHLSDLTQAQGAQGVAKLLSMARWIRTSG
ncbi:MAG: RDD family protein, partial [Verrucomicrobiota bacterium]